MRRTSATILIAMFVSAIFEFGKIDAIGHSPIIVVLVAILADDAAPTAQRSTVLVPAYFCASLAATIILYYGLHGAVYATNLG